MTFAVCIRVTSIWDFFRIHFLLFQCLDCQERKKLPLLSYASLFSLLPHQLLLWQFFGICIDFCICSSLSLSEFSPFSLSLSLWFFLSFSLFSPSKFPLPFPECEKITLESGLQCWERKYKGMSRKERSDERRERNGFWKREKREILIPSTRLRRFKVGEVISIPFLFPHFLDPLLLFFLSLSLFYILKSLKWCCIEKAVREREERERKEREREDIVQ